MEVARTVEESRAGVAAVRHSHSRVVATLRASVTAAWRTSMEVGVRVESENPRTGEVRHTNSAYLTMVAINDDGRPIPVLALVASSPEERRDREEAT